MPTCSIRLLIDSTDLKNIRSSNHNIVIARAASADRSPHVVWQSFTPDEDNTVAWSDDYAIYAANTLLNHGARILPAHSMVHPAIPTSAYAFTAAAQFHERSAGGRAPAGKQFSVHNNVPLSHYPSLIFGLAQSAIINDTPSSIRPINARSIRADGSAVFMPANIVHIWLQEELPGGTVQRSLPETMTTVDLNWLSRAQTLKYDAARRTFIAYSCAKRGFILSMPNVIYPGSAGYQHTCNSAARHAARHQ